MTCDKRKFKCIYSERTDPVSPPNGVAQRPAKRRITDNHMDGWHSDASDQKEISNHLPTKSPAPYIQPSRSFLPQASIASAQHPSPSSFGHFVFQSTNNRTPQPGLLSAPKSSQVSDESVRDAALSLQQFSAPRAVDPAANLSDDAPASQPVVDEEAIVYSQTRMLQDPTGRLRTYHVTH